MALAGEEAWLSADADRGEHLNLAVLYDYLVAEYGYGASLRSAQRQSKSNSL
jgi:hypothetical protein